MGEKDVTDAFTFLQYDEKGAPHVYVETENLLMLVSCRYENYVHVKSVG
jgi:hypothetical protein